jgi:dihydrofolate reductase
MGGEVGMRRVCYGVAMSLDGYIAGPKGEYDWIVMDPDIDFKALMDRFDTFLVGRKTYEMMAGQGGRTSRIEHVVFSRTLDPAAHPRLRIVSRDARAAVLALKEKPGKEIALFGGGELFRSLLAEGVVDAVEVAVIPVLLGGGIPLLPLPGPRAKLKLTRHRMYEKTGTVLLEYEVLGPAAPRRSRRRSRPPSRTPRKAR